MSEAIQSPKLAASTQIKKSKSVPSQVSSRDSPNLLAERPTKGVPGPAARNGTLSAVSSGASDELEVGTPAHTIYQPLNDETNDAGFSPFSAPQQGIKEDLQEKLEDISETIHILGSGPTGQFVAFHLAQQLPFPTPVTLLLHRPLLMQQWHDEGASIKLLKDSELIERSGLKIESSATFQRQSHDQRFPGFGPNLEDSAEQPNTPIDNLIVTTEGSVTIRALSAIRHRLRPWSTICFIQNGLGITDQVDTAIFPDPLERPNYILGRISHSLALNQGNFTVTQRSKGYIHLTFLNARDKTHEAKSKWPRTSQYLLRSLCRCPGLRAVGLSQMNFFKSHLEHIAINSVIGPLSVLFDCSNEELLYNYQASRTMFMLMEEICRVIQSLPEISHVENATTHFGVLRLQSIIISVLSRTGKNTTLMLQDVRAGRKTNIDFFNGYILERAKESEIDCPLNTMVVAMVKAKQAMNAKQKKSYIPFAVDR